MSISYDVTATLREQMKHHEPIVLVAAGFKGGAGANAGGIGYAVETSPTLASADSGTNRTPLVLVYDARGNGGGRTAPTITGDHQNRVTDYTAIVVKYEEHIQSDPIRTVRK